MKAIRIHKSGEGVEGLVFEDAPYPHAAENDVIVRVHAAGFTPGELNWPGTWTDRAGRDRTPTIPGHEVAGEVVELGLGTTGLMVGQRVFGVTDWARDGTLAEYVAVEARNLAALPASIDHVRGAALPLAGLTAWQALFVHSCLEAGQIVMIHGAAGGVGSLAVQLAKNAGAWVVATGLAHHRDTVLGLGADTFINIEHEPLTESAHIVFDVIGGDVLEHSADLVRPGGTLVTIAAPPTKKPDDGQAIFFIVEPDREQLRELAGLVHNGTLQPLVGAEHPLAQTRAAFQSKPHSPGKTVITVT